MEKIEKVRPVGFTRALAAVVLPIALQNFISAAVNSADALMLGAMDQNAMAAVSLAGQITFVLTLFYMCLSIGAGVLTAQYWGKGDVKTIERVLQLALLPSVLISALFCALSLAVPELLMRIFTKDAALIALGASYQRVLAVSYLAMGVSQIYLSVVKSMENARLSACITSTAPRRCSAIMWFGAALLRQRRRSSVTRAVISSPRTPSPPRSKTLRSCFAAASGAAAPC